MLSTWKAIKKVQPRDIFIKKLGNQYYNIEFAFCDELKAYITSFVRSGNTYSANGTAEMIKEIVAISKPMIWKSCSEWTAAILMMELLKRSNHWGANI